MAVKHAKTSSVANNGNAAVVGSDEWNAAHDGPDFVLWAFSDAAQVTWTDMPSALTEFLGLTYLRTIVDLTQVTKVQLVAEVMTAGVSGSKLRVQYSTDSGANWAYLNASGSTPEVSLTSTGHITSGGVTIDAGAQADVWLRVIGISGNGTADPKFGSVVVYGR